MQTPQTPQSTFHRMAQSQQPAVGKMVVGRSKAAENKKKKEGVTLNVSLFFDGTKNNRYNTTLRMEAKSALAKKRQNAQYAPSAKEASQLNIYDKYDEEVSYFILVMKWSAKEESKKY